MRYLITGGAGFIGSHLVEACLQQDNTVAVLDDLSTGRFENIAPFKEQTNFRFINGSITDEDVLDRLAGESDVIVHLAAVVGVQLVMTQRVQTIEGNVLGTERVLKAASRHGT